MESSVKVEPDFVQVKKEIDVSNFYEEHSYITNDLLNVKRIKSEISNLSETWYKEEIRTKPECLTSICQSESVDPCYTDCKAEKSGLVNQTESISHTNYLLSNETIDISEAIVGISHMSSAAEECLSSQLDCVSLPEHLPERKYDETVSAGSDSMISDYGHNGSYPYGNDKTSKSDASTYITENFIKQEKTFVSGVTVELNDMDSSINYQEHVNRQLDASAALKVIRNADEFCQFTDQEMEPLDVKCISQEKEISGSNKRLPNKRCAFLKRPAPSYFKGQNSRKWYKKKTAVNQHSLKPACYKCRKGDLNLNLRNDEGYTGHNTSAETRKRKRNEARKKIFNCDICNKQFRDKQTFDAHLLSQHKEDMNLLKMISNKIHDCPKCNKQFIRKCSLNDHIISQHNDDQNLLKMTPRKIFDCTKCNKPFSCKRTLDGHIIKMHKEDENLLKMVSNKMHDCPKCSKQCFNKSSLNAHIKNCHREDKILLKMISTSIYNCAKCNKQFSYKRLLDSHIISKHKEDKSLLKMVSNKIHGCPKCGKQFMRKFEINAHIVSQHTEDKNLLKMVTSKMHDCPKCNKQFVRKSTLNIHIIRRHSDDKNLLETIPRKNYDCTQCNKRFTCKRILDCHIISKHKEDKNLLKTISHKIHDCPKCSKQFILKTSLNSHIMNHHNNDKNIRSK